MVSINAQRFGKVADSVSGCRATNRLAEQACRPRGRLDDAQQDFDQSCFAGTVWPQQPEYFTSVRL